MFIIIIIIMFRLCHLAVPQPEPHRVASTCSVSTKLIIMLMETICKAAALCFKALNDRNIENACTATQR